MKIRIVGNWLTYLLIALVMASGLAYATSSWENQSAKAFAGEDVDFATKTQSVAIPSSSTTYTLPNQNGAYIICADGNKVYLVCDTSGTPTVAISAGGFSAFVPANSCKGPVRLNATKCAYIGPSASGYLTFEAVSP